MSNVERIDAVSSPNPAHFASNRALRMGQMRTGTAQPRPLPAQKGPPEPQTASAEATAPTEAGEPGYPASSADALLGESAGIEPVSPYPMASIADLRRGAELGWFQAGSALGRLPVLPEHEASETPGGAGPGYADAGSSGPTPEEVASGPKAIPVMSHSPDGPYLHASWVFRPIVTSHFGIVTARFGRM